MGSSSSGLLTLTQQPSTAVATVTCHCWPASTRSPMNSRNASLFKRVYQKAASLDRAGMFMLRVGLVIVLVWIGALKFADYEADTIVPLVANSPLMRSVYTHHAPEYRHYMNKEGEKVPANQRWQSE